MSYSGTELSIHDAEPVEVFKFIGSSKTYRYTSAETELAIAGEVYQPAKIKRRPTRTGTQGDDRIELEIELPADLEVVEDYAYTQSPQRLLLELRRSHRMLDMSVDYILYWKGRVSGFKIEGRNATLRVPSPLSRMLQGNIPNVYYQNPCGHVLFDSRCKVSRATNSTLATVTVVGEGAIEVNDDGFVDDFLKGGEIRVTRTDERRLILGNVTNVVSINFPFFDILVGDTVELAAGCNHSFTSAGGCPKFSNQINYGGHPYIPTDNPFIGEL